MASLDEFNPGRWEAEDEDFLDREDNYVLEKSTSQVVTNVTAKTRRSRILNQHVNGKPSTRMTKQPSHKREPPSFASAKANLRKAPRRGSATNHSKRSSPSSKLKSAHLKQHASAPVRTTTLGTSSEVSAAAASNQKTLEPVVSNRNPVAGAPPSKSYASTRTTRQVLSGVSDDASVESEESLDIKQVFPVLDEKPKPPSPSDPHWKSQQIYIPVKQEKWNEASVMRMHQSMMAIPTRRQSYESPYMKELQFDDDDKSLDIVDIFPVLKENGTNPRRTPLNKPSASGPAILQAARQANANKRWRTAGHKIAATRKAPAAKRAKAPEPPAPPAAPIQPAKHLPPPPTTTAAATQESPVAQGTGQESQSSNEGKKGYDMPTHVSRPSAAEIEAGMHASDELTMDSALLKSGSGQNLKEQENQQTRVQEKVQQQQQQEHEEQERAAAKLERKLSKRSKKDSKSHKKKKKKSSRRQLKDEDLNSVSSHTEVRRSYERETSLGPESLMERQEAEVARRRLKKEKKKKKKHKKKQKRQAQSERLLSSQTSPREEEEPGRLTRSMPEINESQSSSPHASTFAPKGMAESQPAIASKPALDNYLEGREGTSKSHGRSRRSVQSTPTMSSRQSDSKMTTKSDGDIVRAKSSRTRKAAAYYDEQEEDGVLDSYIQGNKQKSALSSRVSVRSQSQTSHATVKKSNVVKKKDSPPSYSQSAAEPDSLKMDADIFMRSAAAGLLYEEEDSLSSGAAAAERRRVRAARDESRRAVDSSSRLGGNSALKPSGPRKEPLDKNVSSTWQPSTSLSPSSSSRVPLKNNASFRRQKQQVVAPKTSVRKASSTRPTVLDNAQMNSVGNFDMMSAVDAAVEAKKAEKKQGQGESTAEKRSSSKKKGLLRRIFSVRHKSPKKPKKPKESKKPTVRNRSAVPQSAGQEELNDYLLSSKSSWFESATQEKQEAYSAPSSSNDVDLHGSLKSALTPPPIESNRSNRLGTSLPHESSARRRR